MPVHIAKKYILSASFKFDCMLHFSPVLNKLVLESISTSHLSFGICAEYWLRGCSDPPTCELPYYCYWTSEVLNTVLRLTIGTGSSSSTLIRYLPKPLLTMADWKSSRILGQLSPGFPASFKILQFLPAVSSIFFHLKCCYFSFY